MKMRIESECGMLRQVRVSWILSKAMIISLLQLHFLLMAGTLSLDPVTRQPECGMLRQVRVSWILSEAIIIPLLQLHFLLMAGRLSLDLMTRWSECGMLRQVRQTWIHSQCLVFLLVLLQTFLLYYQFFQHILRAEAVLTCLTLLKPLCIVLMTYLC